MICEGVTRLGWRPALIGAALASVCAVGTAASAPLLGLLPVATEDAGDASAAESLSGQLERALEEQGGFRVVSIEESGGLEEPTAKSVRRWSLGTGAEAVLISRLEGGRVWFELRSGHSGGLLGGWAVAEALPSEGIVPVLQAMRQAMGAPAFTPAGEAEKVVSEAPKKDPLIGNLRSDGPISIQSDQLDVVSRGGKRHLLFTDNVRVEQGDIELLTRRLDAYYREGQSQPERLEANGDVQVVQGDRIARCERATYLRAEQRVVCSGRARLVQGCDIVRGQRIEFDLEREHFTVMGAASVVLGEKEKECSGEVPS